CGPAREGFPSHAAVLKQAAVALGVPADNVVEQAEVHDTVDEIRALRARAGDTPVALVTSAWHMPRAVALARRAGLRVIPCPADFAARPQPQPSWTDYMWDLSGLDRTTKAVHEYLGLWWARLRGQA
ncbi:MAG TPA: YdcF family protein, partial [Opitutaceae bacterium]